MELTPEQVNTFISNAILNSQIGAVVKGAVERMVAELSKSYNNPFDSVIKDKVAILIEKEICSVYQPMLEAKIKESMARIVTDEMIEKVIHAGLERLQRTY